MKKTLKAEDVTPESTFLNRRVFLKTSIFAASGLLTTGIYRNFRKDSSDKAAKVGDSVKLLGAEKATSYQSITNYNNFYEFSTDKEAVAPAAEKWNIKNWNLEVGGQVENPIKISLQDIADFKTEERIYRFRCVEGWSMVIPWIGLPLAQILEKAGPLATAKYVAFETFFDEKEMKAAAFAGISFPYVEGLRLDEAMHPLTILSTGLYGKKLLQQNGAPIRLVVPWKYGFKSIKSISKITLTDKEPPTTWQVANPAEYGFYSNVNPKVDHPRWTQSHERRIGETRLQETLMMNGYESEVRSLYAGMDLKKYF